MSEPETKPSLSVRKASRQAWAVLGTFGFFFQADQVVSSSPERRQGVGVEMMSQDGLPGTLTLKSRVVHRECPGE